MGFDFTMVAQDLNLPADFVPRYEEMPGYYHLNNSGMALMRSTMQRFGVLDENPSSPKLDKVWPPRCMNADRARNINDWLTHGAEKFPLDRPASGREIRKVRAAIERFEQLLKSTSPDPGKVPAYKFMTNDGWFVVPEECEAISEALIAPSDFDPSSLPEGQREPFAVVQEWASFNSAAALNGGYRVY